MLESAGRLPPFTSFGADVAQPGALHSVVAQIAYQREIILVCGDGSAYASPTALNTVLQFWALRLRHVLYVSDSRASCERLRAGLPELACVWSSRISTARPNHTGVCVRKYWDMRFYFYDIRKDLVARLAVEEGVNVLQTDTDVAWFANPYPMLKRGGLGEANLIAQHDTPLANAGVLYAQNVKPNDGAAWVLTETARRVHLFLYHPEAVAEHVSWAVPPYFSNADEQTLLNDALVSSICNTSVYLWSTAYFEARFGGARRAKSRDANFKATEERQHQLMNCVKRRSRRAAADRTLLRPLHVLGSAAPHAAFFASAPGELFGHHSEILPHRFPGTAAAAQLRGEPLDLPSLAAAAQQEGRPLSFATRQDMGSTMIHLAGVRTGAWSRRAILRAHGLWHRDADVLMGAQMDWKQRQGALRLSPDNVAPAASRKELDTLVANVVSLAAFTGRLPIVPETPCSFGKTYRSCREGCGEDSAETQHRHPAAPRCSWLPPRACWRLEFDHALEHEREEWLAGRAAQRPSLAAVDRGFADATCIEAGEQLVRHLGLGRARSQSAAGTGLPAERNATRLLLAERLRALACAHGGTFDLLPRCTSGACASAAALGSTAEGRLLQLLMRRGLLAPRSAAAASNGARALPAGRRLARRARIPVTPPAVEVARALAAALRRGAARDSSLLPPVLRLARLNVSRWAPIKGVRGAPSGPGSGPMSAPLPSLSRAPPSLIDLPRSYKLRCVAQSIRCACRACCLFRGATRARRTRRRTPCGVTRW